MFARWVNMQISVLINLRFSVLSWILVLWKSQKLNEAGKTQTTLAFRELTGTVCTNVCLWLLQPITYRPKPLSTHSLPSGWSLKPATSTRTTLQSRPRHLKLTRTSTQTCLHINTLYTLYLEASREGERERERSWEEHHRHSWELRLETEWWKGFRWSPTVLAAGDHQSGC